MSESTVSRLPSVTELRELFDGSRSDVEVLERINAQLKSRNDDEANSLQFEVAAALIALRGRRSAGVSERPLAPARGVLAARGLMRPTGEPLYRYVITDAEWSQLCRWIKMAHRSGLLLNASPSASAAFVLWAAEWFRREHQGGHYRWDELREALGADIPYPLATELTRAGLKWWGRRPKIINGNEERIFSLALEGGFPTRLLESRERGWLSAHLRRVIARLSAVPEPDQEAAYQAVLIGEDDTPQSYHQREFHELCAELALAIVHLKKQASANAPRGVSPTAWLDARDPDWRGRLPLRIEREGVRTLLDDLVSTSAEKLASAGARCRRILLRRGSDWIPALELSAEGEIALPKVLSGYDGRYRVLPAGALADVMVGELAVLDPPGEGDGTWLSVPRGSTSRVIAPYPFDRDVQVELRREGVRDRLVWPRGQAERGQVLVFGADQPGPGAEPERMELVGSGSFRSRRPELFVLAPCGYEAVGAAEGGAEPTEIWAGEDLRLFQVHGLARFTAPGEELGYRVEPAADGETSERLEMSGTPARGFLSDDGPRVFAGMPSLRGRSGIIAKDVSHELVWRGPGDREWRPLGRAPLQQGEIEVAWRDPQARALRDRQSFIVLPDGARLIRRPTIEGAYFELENAGDWQLSFDEPDLGPAIPKHGGCEVRFLRAPRRRVSVRLIHPKCPSVSLRVPFPIGRAGFASPEGDLVREGAALVADRLRGTRAFSDGVAQISMELHGSPASRQSFRFTEEMALWSISGEIKRLLSLGRELDQEVVLTLDPGGSWLRVCRCEGEVLIDRTAGLVGFRDADDEIEVDRRLEWRSIVDPSPSGLRIVGQRSWSDDQQGKMSPLPTDLPGHGLVYARVAGKPRGRPRLLPGSPIDLDSLSYLQRASYRADEGDRKQAIISALRAAPGKSDGPDCARFLHEMLAAVDGMPPLVLDVFRYLPHAPEAAAYLLVCAADDAERERAWRLEQELRLTWVLVPVTGWRRAFERVAEDLKAALRAAGIEGGAATIVEGDRGSRLEAILRLEPMLQASLAAAGVCPWPDEPIRTHKQIAQERVRRSVIEGDAPQGSRPASPRPASTCFRADPSFNVSPPSAFSEFDSSQWEALEAPWAAALRALDRVTLSEVQLFRVRAAIAEDPVHFAEAYAAFVREFSEQAP